MPHAHRAAAAAATASDEPYARAAARALRSAADAFVVAPPVGPPADAASVRTTRRAARRLRTALELHAPCFPRTEHRRTLRDVRRVLDALGERRDRDVELELAAELRGAVPPADRPGIDGWRARVDAERTDADRRLADVAGPPLGERLAALADAADALADAVEADPAAHGHRRDVRALDAGAALGGAVPAAGASGLAPADGVHPRPQPRAGAAGRVGTGARR